MFARYLKSGLRQQIQAVVRRAGAAQQSPAVAPLAPPALSISQRLQELETLRATGGVTEEEYKAKRSQIIAEI
jgi:hypothetical protein